MVRNNIVSFDKVKSKNKRDFLAASNLEKKAMQINLRSEEYLELAKKSSQDWKNKWLEIIS